MRSSRPKVQYPTRSCPSLRRPDGLRGKEEWPWDATGPIARLGRSARNEGGHDAKIATVGRILDGGQGPDHGAHGRTGFARCQCVDRPGTTSCRAGERNQATMGGHHRHQLHRPNALLRPRPTITHARRSLNACVQRPVAVPWRHARRGASQAPDNTWRNHVQPVHLPTRVRSLFVSTPRF